VSLIINPPFIVSSTYEHFQIELCAIGLFIQPHKFVTWLPFGLPLNFNTPSQFTTPSKGIRVLGVPLGTSSFTSSFIKDAMLEDVQHVDLFLKMDDVQVAFGILSHCFMQRPSYFLQCTPPSTFIEFFTSFDFFLQMFECFLNLGSFDNLEELLTCRQTFFPIIFDYIEFILMTAIAPNNLFKELGLCSFNHK
jgi:hypothetical protein